MTLQAVIFDLDGVLTDTADYHYRAWKRMADEEGIPFDRAVNEHLRGVSRRESLQIILGERELSEAEMRALMDRKNGYYVEMLEQVSPDDLLPGVERLLQELALADIPFAVASASRNAPNVVKRLGIGPRLAFVADGSSVARAKPAPDLFRYAAAQLNVPPGNCLVIEDAAAGVEAAVVAGMRALALGPAARFGDLLERYVGRVSRREALADVTLADLQGVMATDEEWVIVQEQLDPKAQRHMETVFTLGNGYFASRGSFEEGYPGDQPITFAHGIFDDLPIVRTELANLPSWLDLTVRVDGYAFRQDKGSVLHFRREMDLRQGVLRREVRWQAPSGAIVDFTFERFASYTAEHVGALRFLATAVSQSCEVVVDTGIDGHVSNGNYLHWRHLEQGTAAEGPLWLHSRTRHTGLDLAAAVDLTASGEAAIGTNHCPGQPRLYIAGALEPGQTLQADKLVAYTAARDDVPDAGAVVERAVAQLQGRRYDRLLAAHAAAWRDLWAESDVEIEGDAEAQLAMRFSLFQLLIAAPQRDERVSIGAKTLSGYGYFGHVFWDTEIFVLPFFTYTQPDLARNMLMYRYYTLAGARRKARANGYAGAQYAWESAETGDEVTPTWVPDFHDETALVRIWTGDIEIHISADVAYAVIQYWQVTGDDTFMCEYGAEMVLDTARFWASRAEPVHENGRVGYAFTDVIGPDEYHDHVDNNAFTNRMARWHLEQALAVLDWLRETYPLKAADLAEQLDLNETELARWQEVAANIIFHHDEESGLITQFDGFFDLHYVEPADIEAGDLSMQVVLGIAGANASQVIKQADVLMLLCLLRDEFDARTWQKNWDTYMPITDHRYGSSLGPSMHAWAACEMGLPDEAYKHFMLAARADLRDVRGNAGDGIHAASAGGLWQAAVFGFGGMRPEDAGPVFSPRLPAHWRRLAFKFYWQGKQHVVVIRQTQGGEVEVEHQAPVL